MPREAQHMVNLSTEEFERLQALRTALAEKSGRKVSLAATIGRALEALEANHEGGSLALARVKRGRSCGNATSPL